MRFLSVSRVSCYMLPPPPLILLDFLSEQILDEKFLIMQFVPSSCYFFFTVSKFSLENPVLKNPQSVLLSQGESPSFTLIQNNR
jgi:hypothetical protein